MRSGPPIASPQWYGPKRRQETRALRRGIRRRAPQGFPRRAKCCRNCWPTRSARRSFVPARWPRCAPESAEGIDQRISATRDDDAEVRAAAADSLDAAPARRIRVNALTALLRDPVPAVRIAAARSLSSLPRDEISIDARPAFDAALTGYIDARRTWRWTCRVRT